jgi:hypothetical protein
VKLVLACMLGLLVMSSAKADNRSEQLERVFCDARLKVGPAISEAALRWAEKESIALQEATNRSDAFYVCPAKYNLELRK